MESRVSLRKITYIYLALPVIIFMLTWIRPAVGVPAALLVGFALFLALRKKDESTFRITRQTIFIAAGLAFLWCFFAGQGGFWYQSDDHWARNAIYRDLVYHPWPVVFEKYDVLLNYYIGYWLVPALFCKGLFLLTHNAAGAWLVAKIALLLWSTFSITLCFLLLADIVACKSIKKLVFAVLFFILFSGLDLLGIYITNGKAGMHLEWWAWRFQYSSFTTCLFWVFNQAVPAWIATLLLLDERKVENFAFCGLCIFISSPIPLIGLLPIYITIGIQEIIKAKNKFDIVKKVFSLQNIIACLVIFPICLIYYADNSAIKKPVVVDSTVTASVEQPSASAPEKEILSPRVRIAKELIRFSSFYVLEAGVFLALLFKKHRKSIIFWCLALELFFIPFIHVGRAADFAMRASIPPLVVLMTMVFNDFYDSYEHKNNKFIIYCIILSFAIMTPGKEFYRGLFEIYKNKQFEYNRVFSIEDTISKERKWNNFISYDYSKTLFYKYLAKK